ALCGALERLHEPSGTDIYDGPRADGGATSGELAAGCALRLDALLTRGVAAARRCARIALQLADDPVAALRKLRVVRAAAVRWPRQPLSTNVRMTHAASSPEDAEGAWSTLGTELAFVVSDTIAAQRRIAALLV